ncbi:hypothetical protein IM538_02950 [Cytobacillus suaedae]|nr:hypothetical protein IM538_02950 [Cytobacillus suaedae]
MDFRFYIGLFSFLTFLITIVLVITFLVKLIMHFITKKKPFPKKLLISSLIGTLLFTMMEGYLTYSYTFDSIEDDLQRRRGDVISPTGKFTAIGFYMPYGGAAGGVNIAVKIINNHKNIKPKIVYYSDLKRNFSMEWKDEDTLYILNDDPDYPNENRSIELEIEKEIYHETGAACDSWVMKDEYETCYQN